ncbi:hypothetical protein NSS79_07935 [Paenibacillus sp. FSL L8-0436]|uniref:hypothetical protein n=1 Tax=Paenibacillus sp. FSL L8-0436 TaxID=2954686 RepID=UPI0031587A94
MYLYPGSHTLYVCGVECQCARYKGSGCIQSGRRLIWRSLASAGPTPTASPPVERETNWYIPDWVDDMIQKVDDMIQSFKDLMSPLYDAFAKSYLFIPQIAEIDKVRFLEIWSVESLDSCLGFVSWSQLEWNNSNLSFDHMHD